MSLIWFKFNGWLRRSYVLNDLPLRHRIDPVLRVLNILRAMVIPAKEYRIEDFRLAVTNICNAACCFCSYPMAVMKGKVMSLETVEAMKGYWRGQFAVELTPAIGDPLVDPGLEKKVETIVAAGYKVSFTTNGILLAKHNHWIIKHARHFTALYLSIPGFDPAEYEVQYGVDKGRQAMEGLLQLLQMNAAAGQPLCVRVQIRNREKESDTLNSDGYLPFKRYMHGNVSMHFTKVWDNWSGVVDVATWSTYMRKRLRWSPQINRPCRQLRGVLVNPDGGIRLCGCRVIKTDQDDMLIGKVGDLVKELTARATSIRNLFYDGVFPTVCRGCSFYTPE